MGLEFWNYIKIIFVIFCIALTYGVYINGYYKRRGIKYVEWPLPFFGNMLNVFMNKEHILQVVTRAYNKQQGVRFFGFYAFNKPSIVIKDLDIIKQITVKDFEHFTDHKVFMDEDGDPLFGKNLFFLKGQKWREMRVAMSPAYTGSKMKNMFPFIVECADQVIRNLKQHMMKTDGYLEIEMKDIFTRFTNDVIASTAFGVKINSLENRDNKFYHMGKKATNFSGLDFFKFFGYSAFPKLMKALGITLFSKEVSTFFRKLVHDVMSSRESSNDIRQDMIHLLMLVKKGSLSYEVESNSEEAELLKKYGAGKREWTHDDLTAQALAFLLAGFDPTSALLSFTAYELALNPDIQSRLQQEVDEMKAAVGDNMTYTDLQKMTYLDMVINESLRLWPPDSQIEHVCVKPYELPAQDEDSTSKFQLQVDDDVWIPIFSIQHDPKYYPDPFKFNPERFSPENKPSIHPAAFMPFGIGPRVCIGARFAVMEAKAMMFYLLSEFDIVPMSKTQIPMILASNTFTLRSKHGFWLGLKLRSNQN